MRHRTLSSLFEALITRPWSELAQLLGSSECAELHPSPLRIETLRRSARGWKSSKGMVVRLFWRTRRTVSHGTRISRNLVNAKLH